jgi:hypothetical protein
MSDMKVLFNAANFVIVQEKGVIKVAVNRIDEEALNHVGSKEIMEELNMRYWHGSWNSRKNEFSYPSGESGILNLYLSFVKDVETGRYFAMTRDGRRFCNVGMWTEWLDLRAGLALLLHGLPLDIMRMMILQNLKDNFDPAN